MCKDREDGAERAAEAATVPVDHAVGMVLAHDVTEIRKDEFKGRAFKKGHVVRPEDIEHLKRIGKEHLVTLRLKADESHEDEATTALAAAVAGEGVALKGAPSEGKVMLLADRDGLLTVDAARLTDLNMLGEVLCSTLHTNTVVRKGRSVAGVKTVPLVIKKDVIRQAVEIAQQAGGLVKVREMRRPKAGVVITGREVYEGRVRDAFAPVIQRKIEELGGEIIGTYYAPDDREFIKRRLQELLDAGADLLITTGGMSVDPDDVTRFAIRDLGAQDVVYGSPVLPGAMVLVGYVPIADCGSGNADCKSEIRNPKSEMVPILGIPACGMYHKTTIVDLLLPRLLTGERIGRRELAAMGHGGLCLNCPECRYPVCPFGK